MFDVSAFEGVRVLLMSHGVNVMIMQLVTVERETFIFRLNPTLTMQIERYHQDSYMF